MLMITIIIIKVLCLVCSTGNTLRCFFKYIVFYTQCRSFQDYPSDVMSLRIRRGATANKMCSALRLCSIFSASALLSTSSYDSKQKATFLAFFLTVHRDGERSKFIYKHHSGLFFPSPVSEQRCPAHRVQTRVSLQWQTHWGVRSELVKASPGRNAAGRP